MADKYDLIVIGAGNGGLMTACRASQLGLKVLVLERHNLPGGAATSFVRGRFEFEASLHEIPNFGTGEENNRLTQIFSELGIDVDMIRTKDAFRYVIENDNERSLDVTLPNGRDKVLRFFEEHYPGDVNAVEDLFAAAEDVARGLEYYGLTRGRPDPEILKKEHKNFMKIMPMTAAELFRELGMSNECFDLLTAYWPYVGVDIETVDATRYILLLYSYLITGAFVPKMRSHQLSTAIAERACELGCRILYETEVTKILTHAGAVKGVQTADGRIFESTAVASNAFPEIVYSKLLDDRSVVPAYERKKTNARKYGFRSVCVYLGLDAPPEELGINDYSVYISTTADSAAIYNESKTRNGKEFSLDVCCLNIEVPDCSPEGTTELVLTRSYTADAWADVTEADYVKTKRRVADEMISDLERIMGYKIREHIEEIEIATPITFARYMGSPQGTIYGYESQKWDGMAARTLSEGMEQTVPGLFFTGGHGAALSGYYPTYTYGDRTAYKIMGYVMGGGRNE